jgi:hypothetical protein
MGRSSRNPSCVVSWNLREVAFSSLNWAHFSAGGFSYFLGR